MTQRPIVREVAPYKAITRLVAKGCGGTSEASFEPRAGSFDALGLHVGHGRAGARDGGLGSEPQLLQRAGRMSSERPSADRVRATRRR